MQHKFVNIINHNNISINRLTLLIIRIALNFYFALMLYNHILLSCYMFLMLRRAAVLSTLINKYETFIAFLRTKPPSEGELSVTSGILGRIHKWKNLGNETSVRNY